MNGVSDYKTNLKNFMDRSNKVNAPASRIFRDRQSKRLFEELHQMKASCATTYEELERMHKEVLLCKRLWFKNNKVSLPVKKLSHLKTQISL